MGAAEFRFPSCASFCLFIGRASQTLQSNIGRLGTNDRKKCDYCEGPRNGRSVSLLERTEHLCRRLDVAASTS
jgi:hypothetical protein